MLPLQSSGEEVAVKCLDMKKIDSDPTGLDDLRRETSLLGSCDHPNIIKCYDFLPDPKNCMYWMVLEIVDGGELFDRIIKKEKYNEAEARDTILELLEALKYLHDRQIVHRDLKPENLLLKSKKSDSALKLADFGFATTCNGDDQHAQCGTPGYVAPEIIKPKGNLGIRYGVAVDMWSCGVILYILLGGYPPFYGDDPVRPCFKLCTSVVWQHSHLETCVCSRYRVSVPRSGACCGETSCARTTRPRCLSKFATHGTISTQPTGVLCQRMLLTSFGA